MKMLREEELEPVPVQEARARREVRPGALIRAALLASILTLVFPAGGPWLSQEAFLTAFGRALSASLLVNLIAHLLIGLCYGWVLAMAIYRFTTGLAITLGVALFLPLYGVNYFVFRVAGGYPGNELHVWLAHFFFCLMFSAAYKAMSVPRRRRSDGRPVENMS